jgi:hypothetical protein
MTFFRVGLITRDLADGHGPKNVFELFTQQRGTVEWD